MSGHWYDGIGSGLGHMVDMFTGMPAGSTGTAAQGLVDGANSSKITEPFGKATGLSPYMKMLGITGPQAPVDPNAPAPAPAAKGGGANVTPGFQSNTESKGFKKNVDAAGKPTGGYQLPSVQSWDAKGIGGGNRKGDVEAKEKGGYKVGAPEVYQPNLSKLKNHTTVGQGSDTNGAGHFRDSASGENSWNEFKPSVTIGADGKGSTSLGGGGYVNGFEEKEGYRANYKSKGGNYSANAEAGIVASGGYGYSYGADTKKGLNAQAGIGGKVGAYAQANADAKTDSVKVGGVDYNAGIGVHGDTFIGAKAGASGQVGLGPDFIGAKGAAGAFVGAEAAGDIHGNLGPLGGKLGASGMVGAGAGAEGDISFKDGKFHIGGKLFACLGYGGSLSADATVDVGAIGKSIAGGAEYLGNGIANGANYVGNGIANGANAVGNGIANGASYVGNGIANGANAVGNGIANAGRGVRDFGSSVVSGIGGWFD